tara:strand:- start:5274 stop:5999 length:726 start_codon:yes stop_codon:yes gene_type:complete
MSHKQDHLKLPKEDFQQFLEGLSKVSDTAILNIENDKMFAISSSEDRSLFLWSSLDGDFGFNATLNIPSLKKLSKSLNLITSTDVDFVVKTNHLEYKGDSVKFKYHLYDDGTLVAPKITLSKIESLTYEYEFDVSKIFIKDLLKNSATFNDTNKLYIYTEDDNMIWSLADRTQMNTDVLTIVGDPVDFEMDEFILNLDNVRLLNFGESSSLELKVNKMGVGKATVKNGKVDLNYILSSLTK